MKTKTNRIIAFLLIVLLICGLFAAYWFWWIPYRELSKGKLAILGSSGSDPGIYLMDPLLHTWRHLPTDNLSPSHIAWSPDGKNIAFTYYYAGRVGDAERGIAILNLADMKTSRVYVAPSYNDFVNLVAWTPDGHALIFDINEPRFLSSLTIIKKLDLQSGEMRSITLSSNNTQTDILPFLGDLENLAIAQNGDYVIADPESGIYIASPNLEDIQHISDSTNFFLTPDGKEITIFCNQILLCNYDTATEVVSQTSFEILPLPDLRDGNWSYDEKDLVYLSGYGRDDNPQYIMLLDTRTNRNYTIYVSHPGNLGSFFIGQLAWYSAK